jgi:hypothetical protein
MEQEKVNIIQLYSFLRIKIICRLEWSKTLIVQQCCGAETISAPAPAFKKFRL